MSHVPQAITGPPRATRIAVVSAILLLALGLRLWGAFEDLPFSFNGDESHFVKRAMAMGTGDLNPHWFHKPALLMYMLAFCYGLYFVAGYVLGSFGSVEQFGAHFLNNIGPFVLIGRMLVVALGTATVGVVYLTARRVFHGFGAGVAAAVAAAVLFPMVAGSQIVKADVPAGFFVALSFYAFVRSRRSSSRWPLVAAALLAGVAMGTKYYGAILAPAYVITQLADRFTRGLPWKTVLSRAVAVPVLFVVGFFAVSPYNFIDPTFRSYATAKVKIAVGLQQVEKQFDPDNRIEFKPGPEAFVGASVHSLGRLTQVKALGPALLLLAVFGFFAAIRDPQTRDAGIQTLMPPLFFLLLSAALSPYHLNWRHLNAILPLLCVPVWAGARAVLAPFKLTGRTGVVAAAALIFLSAAPSLAVSVVYDIETTRRDTRVVAYDWVVRNLPQDERILLDEYGPLLKPDPRSIERQRARLTGLPLDEAFTRHQGRALDLQHRYPDPEAMNIDELSHPWWSDRELTDEELRDSWRNRDMGNPIKLRIPKPLAEYRAEGIRYVVTNSKARERYVESEQSRRAFPTFARFYDELDALEPLATFDPEESGGKGPRVRVYDLGVPEAR